MEVHNQHLLEPQYALILYKSHDSTYYSEMHPFHGRVMGAGQPLTQESFDTLIALSTKGKKEKKNKLESSFTFTPDRNLLAFQQEGKEIINLVFSIKPGIKQLFFSDQLGIPSGAAPHPTLIFRYHHGDIKVYATDDAVLTEDSLLYIPPYFNLSDEGDLCLGNVKMKRGLTSFNLLMKEIENSFFNSNFTHSGDLYKKLSYNMVDFWKTQIQVTTPFPMDACLKTSLTVNDLF